MSGPFRDEDLSAKVEHNAEYLVKLEGRMRDLESRQYKAGMVESALEFLRSHYVPQFIGVAIGLAAVSGAAIYVESCARRETTEERTYAEQHPDMDPATRRAVSGCQELCESMGLNGGAIMDFRGVRECAPVAEGCYVTRTGHSCICGNGMGGAVRIDPDGQQTNIAEHPGPARATP